MEKVLKFWLVLAHCYPRGRGMTVKERLLQVIEQMSDDSLAELLELVLLVEKRHEEEISEEEKANIIQSRLAYEAGDYMTIEEFESRLNIAATPIRKKSRVKAFAGFFEKTVPAAADFDEDEAKSEYLKEKHNL